MRDYWKDCVAEAFEDAGIVASKEQLDTVTSWVEGAHENYSMASGDEVASKNYYSQQNSEIKNLKDELYKERQKRVCTECKGHGYTVSYGPHHSSQSQCYKCRGDGRL